MNETWRCRGCSWTTDDSLPLPAVVTHEVDMPGSTPERETAQRTTQEAP